MKAKAYSYVRFSTTDQIKGDSRRRQVEAAEKWCKTNKVELVKHYEDLGVSAFRGRNAQDGALGAFLSLVQSGRIAKGSFLIVESLDRVSRGEIMDAFDLFRSIIKAGVSILTLSDNRLYDRERINDNFGELIVSLSIMSRAHEESRMKAERVGKAWEQKRKRAGEEKMTAKCVAWLRLSDDRTRFILIPERVAIIRRIFTMVANGYGANSIAKMFNRETLPPLGKAKFWHTSYVKKILESRAVIGEFSPATKKGSKRVFGEPIPGYYPAAVPLHLFATVQQIRKARPSYTGKSGFNVFSKLAFDKASGAPMAYVNKCRERGWHYLVSHAAVRGLTKYAAWPYNDFLTSFLLVCRNAALAKRPEPTATKGGLVTARMELDDTERQIGRMVEFLASGKSEAVNTKLHALEARKAALAAKVRELEGEASAKPRDAATVNWNDRVALRENLRATVRRVTVDAAAKWFRAEFLDGRVGEYQENGESRCITWPERLTPPGRTGSGPSGDASAQPRALKRPRGRSSPRNRHRARDSAKASTSTASRRSVPISPSLSL